MFCGCISSAGNVLVIQLHVQLAYARVYVIFLIFIIIILYESVLFCLSKVVYSTNRQISLLPQVLTMLPDSEVYFQTVNMSLPAGSEFL